MIVKVKRRENGFVMIDKRPLEDDRLSWRAKGILAYLLCKPADWEVSIKDIWNKGKEGRNAVQDAMKELEEFGYASLETVRDDRGRVVGKQWNIYEDPTDKPTDRQTENRVFGDRKTKNRVFGSITNNKEELINKELINHTHTHETPKSKNFEFSESEPINTVKRSGVSSATDVATQIALSGVNGDSVDSRMKIWAIVEPYLSTQDFQNQWSFLSAGLPTVDPALVMRDWVTLAPYFDVKEFRINKMKNWIRTASKNANQESNGTGNTNGSTYQRGNKKAPQPDFLSIDWSKRI